MKKTLPQKTAALLFACCVMLSSTECFATITFTYDAAGNRTKRENVIHMGARQANIDEYEQTTDIFDEQTADIFNEQITDIFKEELPEMKISIAPNPTRGILHVAISNAKTLQGAEIRIFNPQGRLIKQVNDVFEMTTLDISTQPNGMYIMQIVLNNKEISTWKIIKN